MDDLPSAVDEKPGVDAAGIVSDAAEGPSVAELRRAALLVFLESLHDPGLRSEDPLVKARSLVAVADAKESYAAFGGRPHSRFAERYAHVYEEARAVVAADAEAS